MQQWGTALVKTDPAMHFEIAVHVYRPLGLFCTDQSFLPALGQEANFLSYRSVMLHLFKNL